MKKLYRSILSLLFILVLSLSLSTGVFAGDGSGGGGGNGSGGGDSSNETPVIENTDVSNDIIANPSSGDGSGGGKSEPLSLVSSDPTEVSSEISLDTVFNLEFSKNIAYVTIRDNNIKAFTLWDNNTQVPVTVTMADDQLEPDLRNYVLVVPEEDLTPDTMYTLKVDSSLASKSGAVLSEPLELSYSTPAAVNTNSNMPIFIAIGAAILIAIIFVVSKRKKS